MSQCFGFEGLKSSNGQSITTHISVKDTDMQKVHLHMKESLKGEGWIVQT